jgi:sugar phosphate isomerase/epimerase
VNKIHIHIPYLKIGDHISLIREHRLNLEVYLSSSSLDAMSRGDITRLRAILDHNPSLSIHAPFMDLSPGAVDSKVRAVTLERFSHVLDIAEVLLPEVVVYHSGYEKWKYAHRPDIWLKGSIMTWSPLIERAKDLGVKIAIENIFEDEPSNLRMLMDELYSEHFGLCFDTGHFNLFSTVSLSEWLTHTGPYILALHLHDNDKSFDSHLPIGDGTFDFGTLFSILGDNTFLYTIESHTPEMVLKSMERLRQYTG